MPSEGPWTIDAYATEEGEIPVAAFLKALAGRDKTEAVALVKLLEERGNQLQRPRSASLGDGLFELRGRQVRIFYVFLPRRVAVLLDGLIKKRQDIPPRVLQMMRERQKEVLRRGQGAKPKAKPKKAAAKRKE